MIKAIYIFLYVFLISILLTLGGCSTIEPSTAITEVIKSDVKIIEKQVEAVKKTIPAQCQTPAITAQLDNIQEAIKTISTKADTVAISCKTEKEIYKQQINKLHIIIGGLIVVCGLLGYILVKKKTIAS